MESFSANATMRKFHHIYLLNLNLEGLTTDEVEWEYCHFPFTGLRVYCSGGNAIKEFILLVRCPLERAFSKIEVLVFGTCNMCFIIRREDDQDYNFLSELIKFSDSPKELTKSVGQVQLKFHLSAKFVRQSWYHTFTVKSETLANEKGDVSNIFVGYDLYSTERVIVIHYPLKLENCDSDEEEIPLVLGLKLKCPEESDLYDLVESYRNACDGVILFIPDSSWMSTIEDSQESFTLKAFDKLIELDNEEKEEANEEKGVNWEALKIINEQRQGLEMIIFKLQGCLYVSKLDHIELIRVYLFGIRKPVRIASTVITEDKIKLKKAIKVAGLMLLTDSSSDSSDGTSASGGDASASGGDASANYDMDTS